MMFNPSSPPSASRREGFTLLEMLVVIAVMALLMGITFRMMKPSEHARAIASTIKTINLTSAAIAEYHAEYGIYPPVVDPVQVETKDGYQPHGGLNVDGDEDNTSTCGFIPGVAVGYFAPTKESRATLSQIKPRDSDDVFCFGLAAYLVDRRDPAMKGTNTGYGKGYKQGFLQAIFDGEGSKLTDYFGDGSHWYERGKGLGKSSSTPENLYNDLEPASKDLAFYKRIRGITSKVVVDRSYLSSGNKSGNFYYYTIRDAYGVGGHDLVYICPPPFTSYALFSAGPDCKVVTDDPLNPDAQCSKCRGYHNRDNVYSTVNIK